MLTYHKTGHRLESHVFSQYLVVRDTKTQSSDEIVLQIKLFSVELKNWISENTYSDKWFHVSVDQINTAKADAFNMINESH